MELETEMQLSSYHRCSGCSITMVDCVKDFLYSKVLYTRGDQPLWNGITLLLLLPFFFFLDISLLLPRTLRY